jgi:hypothetical protein
MQRDLNLKKEAKKRRKKEKKGEEEQNEVSERRLECGQNGDMLMGQKPEAEGLLS